MNMQQHTCMYILYATRPSACCIHSSVGTKLLYLSTLWVAGKKIKFDKFNNIDTKKIHSLYVGTTGRNYKEDNTE